jgi:hypothetical protein
MIPSIRPMIEPIPQVTTVMMIRMMPPAVSPRMNRWIPRPPKRMPMIPHRIFFEFTSAGSPGCWA